MKLAPRLRLRTLLALVALSAFLLWAGAWIWSPLNRFSAQLRADQPAYLRLEAAMGLGYGVPSWEADRAIAVLIATLGDPSPRVRESASAGLAGHGPRAKAAIPHLLKRVDDPDGGARCSAVGALGFIAEADSKDEVVPALTRALDDADIDVRLMAADGLIKLGAVDSLAPVIIDAMATPNYENRSEVLVGRLGSKARVVLPGFAAATSDPDPRRREAGLRLLLDHAGPEAAKSALRRASGVKDEAVRKWAAATMDRLGMTSNP